MSGVGDHFIFLIIQVCVVAVYPQLETFAPPTMTSLDVKCGRSGMTVYVQFDRLFWGIIYSKGYYHDERCNYVSNDNTGKKEYSFIIPIKACGTNGNPTKSFIENTIIVQNDPLIQEIWDQARNLRCTWQNSISKTVDSKPIAVAEPEKVHVGFDSNAVNAVMRNQRGTSPLSGAAMWYVHDGRETSVVIYVKDSSHNMDANAVSCRATSSTQRSIRLIDRSGCLIRPDLITPFSKVLSPKGVQADMMMFANLKDWQLAKDPNFHMECHLEVCEGRCLPPCALGQHHRISRLRRAVPPSALLDREEAASMPWKIGRTKLFAVKANESDLILSNDSSNNFSLSNFGTATSLVLVRYLFALRCRSSGLFIHTL